MSEDYKKTCTRLLDMKRSSFSVMQLYKQTWKAQALRALLLVSLLILSIIYINTEISWAFLFGSGMMLGAIIEDYAYLLKHKKLWPLNLKITNWDTVKDISENKDT